MNNLKSQLFLFDLRRPLTNGRLDEENDFITESVIVIDKLSESEALKCSEIKGVVNNRSRSN